MRAELLALLPLVAAQTQEVVWSAVVVTRHGERIPLILEDTADALTPLGARQAYDAGQFIRSRYVESAPNARTNASGGSSLPISGIQPYIIDSSQLQIIAPADEVIVTSAQAFMQGLYPPLKDTADSNDDRSSAVLSNGSVVSTPLDGYQYGFIDVAGANDPAISTVLGQFPCDAYRINQYKIRASSAFQKRINETQAFYNTFIPMLVELIPSDSVGYENAFPIFEYINYMYYHNGTTKAMMNESDLDTLRVLAHEQQWAFNGNVSSSSSSSDNIQAIAGRTLAFQVLDYFTSNIMSGGVRNKLNMMFTSHEPFLAFFALAGLDNQSPNFEGMPEYGSSMVFELFSRTNNISQYPTDTKDLFVRFMFRNGSMDLSQESNLQQYAFGYNSPSSANMQYDNFQVALNNILVEAPDDWCQICMSSALFCAAYDEPGYAYCPSPNKDHGVSRPVAGVIGAVVTLAAVALGLLAAVFLGGVRFTTNKPRSQLGGFKGAEKMASDADLSLTKSAAMPAGAAVAEPRGHERVGSWEMKDGANKDLKPDRNTQDSGFASLEAASRPSFQRPSFETGHSDLGPNPESANRFG